MEIWNIVSDFLGQCSGFERCLFIKRMPISSSSPAQSAAFNSLALWLCLSPSSAGKEARCGYWSPLESWVISSDTVLNVTMPKGLVQASKKKKENTKGVWAGEGQWLSFKKISLQKSLALKRQIFLSLLTWNWNNKKQTFKWPKKRARAHSSRGFVILNTLGRTDHSLGFNYSHFCNGAFGEGHEGEGREYFVVLAFISILLLSGLAFCSMV